MQVEKLRYGQDKGLVPAGRYFAKLAQDLREATAQESARREEREARDRKLEARYRKASAARGAHYVSHAETRAPM